MAMGMLHVLLLGPALLEAATPAQLQAALRVEENVTVDEPTGTASCIRNTGATCWSKCSPPATCSSGQHCVCPESTCSSFSGGCAASTNRRVGSRLTLRSARRPGQFLAFSANHVPYLTSDESDPNHMLSAFALPVMDDRADTGGYILTTQDGQHALSCVSPGEGLSSHLHGGVCVPIATDVSSAGIMHLGLFMKNAPPYDGEPEGIQTLTVEFAKGVFLSYGGISGFAGVHKGGAGSEDYWIAEPPLEGVVVPYDGPKCFWDCGGYGTGGATHWRYVYHVMQLIVPLLLCIGLCICCVCFCSSKDELKDRSHSSLREQLP